MNLSISRNELYNKLAIVQKVINSKTPIPIAENFLFKIENNVLTIVATDLETTLSTAINLENCPGSIIFAMPPKIMEILKELPEQILSISIDEETFKINLQNESGSYKGDFLGIGVGQNGEDFPRPKELDTEYKSLQITSELLLNGISRTVFATAEEDSRPTMTGVLFDMFDNNITFVATDAHKLVKYNMSNINIGFENSFILPKKPALTLKNILVRTDELIEISFDDKNISFRMPEYEMICRRIEGKYPNYNAVIQKNPFKAIVDRQSLLSAIKRVKVFSSQGTGLIIFNISENKIEVSTQDIDFSTSAKEIIVCQYSDQPMEIGFKAALLEEILSNMQDNQIVIELADASKAGIIVPFENDPDQDLLMLLMPMFLN
jgi:DNA polymerase III, beta subunit